MIDLGIASGIDAQAFGQPGQRTFRVRIVAGGESASLWMEKEHLLALSQALRQMLAQLDFDDEQPPAEIADFPVVASHDFRVGRLGLGYYAADGTVILYAYELGSAAEDDDEATLRARITQPQVAALIARLDEVIAGGRPMCPLCGAPVNPEGHSCVRSNGHSQQPIPDDAGDE
ncbi:MAG TPA: DUF3090 family protein [Dehalococcoidia bacterium]|nr:DUF3090 family protein [Dehalococcoidia bacterium]